MNKIILTTVMVIFWSLKTTAFCGFYVAKAGSELYNNKSEIILVRDGQNTTITMSNDFKGDVKDFAMVVPVPNVLKRSDIVIVDRSIFQKLDAYSSPRLVEYYDPRPCYVPVPQLVEVTEDDADFEMVEDVMPDEMIFEALKYKVKIEAKYNVEEYEILVLSAEKSNGLKRWLTDNGYKIPEKAEEVLEPYIKSGMKFFVVKVDLNKYNPKANGGFLRPIQIKVKSEKFMLPIRLGMANSKGEQDMMVYAFSKQGRIECTNYRTVKMPTGNAIPTFIKKQFGKFYTDAFRNAHSRQGRNAVFLEYSWNVTPSWSGVKCDPCVGAPPIAREFVIAGVPWSGQANQKTFFTRLHVRYSIDKFPEDLFFQETPNKETFQARYVVTHPATGDMSCDEGKAYMKRLRLRRRKELQELAVLTQWDTREYENYVAKGTDEKTDKRHEQDKNVSTPIAPNDHPGGSSSVPKGMFIFTLALLISYGIKKYNSNYKWIR